MSRASEARARSSLAVYVGRIRQFDRTDWAVYLVWVGMMLGLVGTTGGFLAVGHAHGVHWPADIASRRESLRDETAKGERYVMATKTGAV